MKESIDDRRSAAAARGRVLREKLIERLEEEEAHDLARRLEKCGQELHLVCTCCGEYSQAETRCDLKWCPSCQRALATRTSLRYEGITKSLRWPLFLTLTTKNFDEDEEDGFDFVRHIRRGFAKLRRLRWWRGCVKGGVASIEVTNTGNGWHPHLHALVDCKWLAVRESAPRIGASKEEWEAKAERNAKDIAEQWSLCLGGRPGSAVFRRVWKRDGGDAKPITTEVLKYSAKGSDLVKVEGRVAPLIRMLMASRLVTSWGNCYGHPAAKRPKPVPSMCRCGATGSRIPESCIPK